MKDNIYTVPVMDAFRAKGECPFCDIHNQLEKDSLEFTLGTAYMERDIRGEMDESGFCRHHYEKLFSMTNRLGLAFILQTHMLSLNKKLAARTEDYFTLSKKGLFGKKDGNAAALLCNEIDSLADSCYICNRVRQNLTRYMDTFFFLWSDRELRTLVEEGKGFCLPHLAGLLRLGSEKLSASEFSVFLRLAVSKFDAGLKAVGEDVEWFVNKYDYRFRDEPWKNSKDAIPRAIQRLSSLDLS